MIIKQATALVTGASSGIGTATALALAAKGARLLVHGRDAAAVAAVAARVSGTAIVADLSTPAGVDELVAAMPDRVDIVVANAGLGWAGPFEAMTPDRIEQLIAVNLAAPVRLTHGLLPHLRTHGGFLAYVTSIAGRMGVAGEAVYAATKGGLDVFAESLRLELRSSGIGVGVVVPGVVQTPFFERRGQPYERRRPRPIPAAEVAAALVHMIETAGAETYRPRWLRFPVVVRALLPSVYRGLAARF